jgi:hypothetical protein
MIAMGAVAGVTVLDIMCTNALMAQPHEARGRRIERRWDYSDRSGLPRPPNEMRGAARDFQAPRDRFLTTLKDAGVALIADVRAVALSRKRGFAKSALRDVLESQGIVYRHFRELGTPKEGRQAARAGDGDMMRRIYCEEVLTSDAAQKAFEELEELASGQPICLLCFERDPANCHRTVLAQRLAERGWRTVDLTVL